jgi:hypothetical protein
MQYRQIPEVVRRSAGAPTIEAHSRGNVGSGGHYNFATAGGARVTWSMQIVPMCNADALRVRAWLHSLRGPSGGAWLTMPTQRRPAGAVGYYSDDAPHSDGSGFADSASDGSTVADRINGSAAAGATSLNLLDGGAASFLVGDWMAVDTTTGRQIVRISGVSGVTVSFRPALRASALAFAAVRTGAIGAQFRLVGNPPAVPLINGRSREFTLDLEEAY